MNPISIKIESYSGYDLFSLQRKTRSFIWEECEKLKNKKRLRNVQKYCKSLRSIEKNILKTKFKELYEILNNIGLINIYEFVIDNKDSIDYFKRLQAEINDSKRILDLEDDWDDEGSPSYDETTLDRAIKFLLKQLEQALFNMNKLIDIPEILEGPDGSIDILWDKENFELLLNVPSEEKKPISFYGFDRRDKEKYIKGTFDENFESIFLNWLTSRNAS